MKKMPSIFLSGHPLDNYKLELDKFCTHGVRQLSIINKVRMGDSNEEVLAEFEKLKNRELCVGGLVVAASQRITKAGKPFGTFVSKIMKTPAKWPCLVKIF